MKIKIIIFYLLIYSSNLNAQKVYNFDKDGNKLQSIAEFIDISVINTPPNKIPAGPAALTGIVLGPVYNIISSAIKNGLEKRQKSFIASYSNSGEFSGTGFNQIGMKKLIINRYAINSLDEIDSNHLMATYEIAITADQNSLILKLENIFLKRSKARYKKNDNLSILINIKSSAITQTQKKDSVSLQGQAESKSIDNEGTITIPIYKLTGKNQDLQNKDNVINTIRLNGINFSNLSSVKFAVTITETNITHIDPSRIQSFITGNNADIQAILKAVFNASDK